MRNPAQGLRLNILVNTMADEARNNSLSVVMTQTEVGKERPLMKVTLEYFDGSRDTMNGISNALARGVLTAAEGLAAARVAAKAK
jgi:hypothetical protein